MIHRFHPNPDRSDPPDAILWDDCERCDEQTDALGLDRVKLRKAWNMMLAVELPESRRAPSSHYRTANERRLGRTLYSAYIINEKLTVKTGGTHERD